jgi:hypothetical protein
MEYFIGIDYMKLLDRLLEAFGLRRSMLLGSVDHPNDFMKFIRAVRASAYLKITGKYLVSFELADKTQSEIMNDNFSPLRRLSRRYVD